MPRGRREKIFNINLALIFIFHKILDISNNEKCIKKYVFLKFG